LTQSRALFASRVTPALVRIDQKNDESELANLAKLQTLFYAEYIRMIAIKKIVLH